AVTCFFYLAFSRHFLRRLLHSFPTRRSSDLGVREQLLPLYIQYEDFKSINKLFNAYKDDITAAFLFSKALVTYFTEGLTTQSIRLLKEADSQNPYVIDYLLGDKQIPEQKFEYIGLGDEREAIVYAQGNTHLWADAKDLLKTLKE